MKEDAHLFLDISLHFILTDKILLLRKETSWCSLEGKERREIHDKLLGSKLGIFMNHKPFGKVGELRQENLKTVTIKDSPTATSLCVLLNSLPSRQSLINSNLWNERIIDNCSFVPLG